MSTRRIDEAAAALDGAAVYLSKHAIPEAEAAIATSQRILENVRAGI